MTQRSLGRDVYLFGNIASGKTTLARLLGERVAGSAYVPEPVERNPFLPLYLLDQSRWGMACMARYFLDYAGEWDVVTAAASYAYHFVDAGTPTNRLLYGRYLQGEHVVSPDEYGLYTAVCDLAERAHGIPRPYAFIYLRSSPDACMARMRARGWGFQVGAVDIAYLQTLHRYAEAMSGTLREENFPLLVLRGNAIDLTRTDGQDEIVAKVERFLANLRPALPRGSEG